MLIRLSYPHIMEHEIDRLDKFLTMRGINDNEFTVTTGISNGWIGSARKKKLSITNKVRPRIFKAYPEINPVWLLTGEGEMLIKPTIHKINGSDLPKDFDASDPVEMSPKYLTLLKKYIALLEKYNGL